MTNDVERTPDGKFPKGQSGNPAGRPKGRRNKITKLSEKLELAVRQATKVQDVVDVLNALKIEALKGNAAAAGKFLEFTLIKPKPTGEDAASTVTPVIRIEVVNTTYGAGEKPVSGITIENDPKEPE